MSLFVFWSLLYFGFSTHNIVQGKTICEAGRFPVNGVCVQQFNFCPVNSIFLNGICFPTSSENCPKGQIWINNECCNEECIVRCEKTRNCPCCGKLNTNEVLSCNINFIPTCNGNVIPCILTAPKRKSAEKPIVCPVGSVLVKGHCLLMYCSGIYRNGRCFRLQCPPGTFWFNNECLAEKSNNYHISYNHSYNIDVNSSQTNVVIKNVNNLYINTLTTDQQTEVPGTWEEILKEDEQNTTNCCQIISPRICKQHQDTKTWDCFNRKHEYCGEICRAKTICLLPAKSRQCRDYIIVVPPPKTFTEIIQKNAPLDCSGCVLGDYNKCHHYCYHYAPCSQLSPLDCQSLNEEEFCANNTGLESCLKADASYDSLPNFA